MRWRWWGLIFVWMPVAVWAADGTLTLSEAVRKAYESNPSIQALRESVRSTREDEAAAGRLKFGELLLNGGVSLNSDATLVRPMTEELIASGFASLPFDDRMSWWNLDYRVPLFTGGRLKSAERAGRARRRAEEFRLRGLKWQVRYQVTHAYVNLLAVTRQREAWEQYVTALGSLRSHVQSGMEIGKYAQLDVLKVNYEIETAKSSVARLEQERRALKAVLCSLMGEEEMGESFDLVPVRLEDLPDSMPSVDELVRLALENRSDVKRVQALADASGYQVKMARADRLPQVSLDARFNAVAGGNIGFNDQFWSITANVSVPVFDMGRRKRTVRKAVHGLKAARHQVSRVQLDVRREVMDAVSLVHRARQDMATVRASVQVAREVARLEQLKYDNGRGSVDDLLQARSREKLAETRLVQAQAGYYVAVENLKKVIEGDFK